MNLPWPQGHASEQGLIAPVEGLVICLIFLAAFTGLVVVSVFLVKLWRWLR